MFTISLRRLKSVLNEFRRILGIGRLRSRQPITFTSLHGCLSISAKTNDTIVRNEKAGDCYSDGEFTVALSELAQFGCIRGNLKFERLAENVVMRWMESGRDCTRTLVCLSDQGFPTGPLVLYSNGADLARTLHQAASITDPESKRYSLGCLRLRSTDGQIAATDGRQAFVHEGFSFPAGVHLVPAGGLKNCSQLDKAIAISVGVRDDWFCFRIGTADARWSLDVKLIAQGRFPDVDKCFPKFDSSQTKLKLSDQDASFLMTQLAKLSPDRFKQGPITLDLCLDAALRLRLRSEECERMFPGRYIENPHPDSVPYHVCEIALSTSTAAGLPLRFAMDHLHLLSAIRLGFREFYFQDAGSPVVCKGNRRSYVCSACSSQFAVLPSAYCLELKSEPLEPAA